MIGIENLNKELEEAIKASKKYFDTKKEIKKYLIAGGTILVGAAGAVFGLDMLAFDLGNVALFAGVGAATEGVVSYVSIEKKRQKNSAKRKNAKKQIEKLTKELNDNGVIANEEQLMDAKRGLTETRIITIETKKYTGEIEEENRGKKTTTIKPVSETKSKIHETVENYYFLDNNGQYVVLQQNSRAIYETADNKEKNTTYSHELFLMEKDEVKDIDLPVKTLKRKR